MANRKVLLLTYHFPPSAASGSFRMLGFARHLRKFGWEPIVVAPPIPPREPLDLELGRQVPEDVCIYRAPYPHSRLLKPVRRFAPNAIWFPRALLSCLSAIRAEKPQAILTSGPPHRLHLLGALLKRLAKLPLVVDFRDPWIHHSLSGAAKPHSRWTAWLEKTIMRQADAIVGNAPLACQALRRAYPGHAEKIVAVTNGYDPDSFSDSARRPSAREFLRVVHTGEVYAGRDPRPFLDAIKVLHERPAGGLKLIHASFLGREDTRGVRLEPEVTARGLRDIVHLSGHVAYAQSLHEMAEADILLLLDSPGRRVGVPAKLYEYLGAGRPILALAEPDSDVAWVLRESGVPHRIVLPTDVSAITRALTELREAVEGASSVPRPLQRKNFTRERMAEQLATLLDTLPTRPARVPRVQARELASLTLES